MIGRLRGKIIEATPNLILLDVGGVGYEVVVPLSTYYQMDDNALEIILHIQMIVREDAQLLFGFASLAERELFRLLIKVNKVGPKLAIAILSGAEPVEFSRIVVAGDVKALVALPGVGKKTAEKIILELKDRLPDFGGVAVKLQPTPAPDHFADAETALIGLGFKPQDTARVMAQIERDLDPEAVDASTIESLIKQALKALT